jgi:hypothetical protein
MSNNNSNRLKTSYDLLEEQQQAFSNGGELLRNIFSISIKHPFLSLIFVLSFGVLTNALFEFVALLTAKSDFNLTGLLIVIGGLILIQLLVYLRIKWLHRDLFVPITVDQKKVLVTLVSPRTNFKETPSYAIYEAILYNAGGHANVNSLQKVVLVTSESLEAQNAASHLKTHIEASGREAVIKGIAINNRSLLEIQKQIDLIFVELKNSYKPHEIVADYTGGTKDMSIGLLKTSEKELILPVYLNDATNINHSKYT